MRRQAPFTARPLWRVALAAHGAAGGAVIVSPRVWPWALGVCVGSHAAVVAAGLVPRCTWMGPNIRSLSAAAEQRGELALTFDDGPDPQITPRVLDLLDSANAKGTFFVIGQRAEKHPELVREMTVRGHAVENHSHTHPVSFYFRSPAALRREIEPVQSVLQQLCGRAPRFFRAPAGIRSPLLQRELERCELQLVSWTRRGYDTVEWRHEKVLARLLPSVSPGAILVLHDGGFRRHADAAVLTVLPSLLARMRERSLRSVTLLAGQQ